MLTKYDEMFCHQVSSTFDHPATSAREWTERIWFMVHDTAGDVVLVAGFGLYPNRNIMDAFVCVAVERKRQHVVRASRELRPRYDEVAVGPFAWDVVEPMRKVRASLGQNEHGLSYDILFDATLPPYEEDPPQFFRTRGRVVEDINRYFQVGRPSGWIEIGGRRITIDPRTWRSQRDHSWGIRRGAMDYMDSNVQPGEIPVGFLYSGACWDFGSWSASYHVREGWDARAQNFSGGFVYAAESGKELLHATSIDHRFTFREDFPELRQVNGGSVRFHLADGSTRDFSIRPMGVMYVGAGGYSYRNVRGFTHGMWMGPSWMDGFELDLTDPAVLREATYLDELACEVRCGDEIGYGLTELTVIGKYPKYGYQGF